MGLQRNMERVQICAMNIIYPNTPYIEALANVQLTPPKKRRAQLYEHFFKKSNQPQHKLHKPHLKARATTHNTRCRTACSLPQSKNQQDKVPRGPNAVFC